MKTSVDPRHQAREKIIQELFSISFHQGQSHGITAKNIMSQKETIDKYIAKAAPEWPLDKIAHVDLAMNKYISDGWGFLHNRRPDSYKSISKPR